MKDLELISLELIYSKLKHDYGTPVDYDYMEDLKNIIDREKEENLFVDSSEETQKDNEIKMQMAKEIFISAMHQNIEYNTDNLIEVSCNVAEQIFNRFNK